MPGLYFSVRKVEVISPYTLKLWFEDGCIKTYDMTPLLGLRCFTKLKNEQVFRKARPFGGSVIWDDDTDIAPEELYDNGIPCE